MVEKIKDLCRQNGTSLFKLEKELGFGNGTIGKWGKNGRLPTYNRMKMVADYFGITVEDLTGEAKEKAPTPTGERTPNIENAKIALFGGDGEVTDEMWQEALFAAELIKERHRRKKE